ncbi:hypothetical protein PY093_03745 [Cytobacillus sp. S13-E01]|uniref:hypothetical protein n=1 Tax=Cytobacillus sp. S13-E01 TaxID=3031326 RepID=UPI0023D808B1|nr:hypothetical protein [Cytobacillus sp. S13-E01]MDF0725826.1 hypothetical protein [Cytobacillus sp. S13-E01]
MITNIESKKLTVHSNGSLGGIVKAILNDKVPIQIEEIIIETAITKTTSKICKSEQI